MAQPQRSMPKSAEEMEAERIFSDDNYQPAAPAQDIDRLGRDLLSEFERAVIEKREIEERLLRNLRQYAGKYSPEMQGLLDEDPERSAAFFRITRAKVKAVDAKMSDLILTGKKTWGIEPSPEPRIPDEIESRIREDLAAAVSTPERQVSPEEIPDEAMKEAVDQYCKGAASRMENKIDDQFTTGKMRRKMRQVIHSGNLYGLGILKGPMTNTTYTRTHVKNKKTRRWEVKTSQEKYPFFSAVSIWRYYPDLSVVEQDYCQYEWEHHRLPRAELVRMTQRKSFKRGWSALIDHIKNNPMGLTREFIYEQEVRSLGDRDTVTLNSGSGLYDVFERWGWVDAESLRACGVTVPNERMHESFYSNIWVLPTGQVIKIRLMPAHAVKSPYKLYKYESDDETSLFPEGLASIIEDDQRRVNACYRSAEDNLGITSGPQIEANLDLLPGVNPEEAITLSPFKVWLRAGGDTKDPAVRAINIPSNVGELIQAAKSFEENAHEASLIPKFAYGDNPTNGAAGTASGMSMLMSQVNISLKDLVLSFEDGVLKPAVEESYEWNMLHNDDDSIKADFQINAMGATNLIAQEVQVQQALQFGSSLQPEERPYVDFYKLLTRRADIQDFADTIMPREEAEAKMKNPMAEQMMKLELDARSAALAKDQAEAAKKAAEALLAEARALNEKMGAAYAAMQAGGVAATSPAAAKAGDSLLQAGGWRDSLPPEAEPADDGAPPQQPQDGSGRAMPPAESANPQQIATADAGAQPVDANTGQQAGIETMELEGGMSA